MGTKELVKLGKQTYEVIDNMITIDGITAPYRLFKNNFHYHMALLPDMTPYYEMDGMEELEEAEAKMNEEVPPANYSEAIFKYLKENQRMKYMELQMAGKLFDLRYQIDKDCLDRYYNTRQQMIKAAQAKGTLNSDNWTEYVKQMSHIGQVAEELTLQHMWETYAPETQIQ